MADMDGWTQVHRQGAGEDGMLSCVQEGDFAAPAGGHGLVTEVELG